MGLGHYNYFNSSYAGTSYTSESCVQRRQILTPKDDPRAERVNPLTAEVLNLNFHPLEVVSR